MKKTIIIPIILSAITAFTANAQVADRITIRNTSVETDTETVSVSFTAAIDKRATKGGTTVVYAPVITDGQYQVSLPAIVVRSARAERNWSRHEFAARTRAAYENGIHTRGGVTLDYAAVVPFQPWMHGARIDIEAVSAGCCDTRTELLALAAPILPEPEPEPLPEPEPEIVLPEPTVAEYLAEAFPFVLPFDNFDPLEPIKFYDDERDNSLTGYTD